MAKLPHVYRTVVHMLLDAVEHAPDREALVFGGEHLTYRQYLRCVSGFADELRGLGAAGERVALVMGNSVDICIATFAVHMSGAQVVPLNPAYTVHELEPMLADAAPRVVIYDDAVSGHVEPVIANSCTRHAIRIGGDTGRRLVEWRDREGIKPLEDLPRPGDLATLQYTGGTTGRAKGANISHGALSVNISQREALVPTRKDTERLLCVMPLFHCYAVAMGLHNMVYCRGTLVMMPRYHPEDLLAALSTEEITLFGGSPTLFISLMNYVGFKDADFSRLYASYSGSAALPAELLRCWESVTGAPVIEGYGQSESGPVVTFNPLNSVRKPESVGVQVPQMELDIVDTETGKRVLPIGETGEIRIRGPQIMTGYHNREAETRRALRDGWLYTGDIGDLDTDGYLFIRGRKKELIIVSGYNVYPREIEETLHRHPDVREAAVVGRPDAYRGELPIAYVVLRADLRLDPDALRKYCGEHLAAYKLPAQMCIVSDLPKTPVGKIDKVALARRAGKDS